MPVFVVREDRPGQRLVLGTKRAARLTFDRRSGISVARFGWFGTVRVPPARIDRVVLEVARAGRAAGAPADAARSTALGLELALVVRYSVPHGMRELRRAFTVRELDVDGEALDFAFRIARATGLEGFSVRPDRAIELVLRAPAEQSPYRGAVPLAPTTRTLDELAGDAVRPLPELASAARYDAERRRFEEPAPPVGDVAAGETIAGVSIAMWTPDRIELATTSAVTVPRIAWNALAGTGRLAFGAGIALAAGAAFEGCRRFIGEGLDEAGFYSWKDYAAFGVAIAGLVALFVATVALVVGVCGSIALLVGRLRADVRYLAARRISFDGERLAIHARSTHVSIAASELRMIALRSHEDLLDGDRVWSELFARTADRDVLVLVAAPGAEKAHRELERLAVGLARRFDVPWQIERQIEQQVERKIERQPKPTTS